MSYLARFKHDFQWTDEWIRPDKQEDYPETVPLFVEPRKGAGKDDVRLSAPWTVFIQTMNPDLGRFVLTPQAGWLNTNESADSLGFGGNVVRVLDEPNDGWARVDSFKADSVPPDPASTSFQSGDPRIQKFTVVTRGGQIRRPGAGLDVYTVLLGRGELYVPRERLEPFPSLPATVKIDEAALRGAALRVRSKPEVPAPVVNGIRSGTVEVLEYAPRGSDVWGQIAGGWIALLYEGRYFTSWKMQTTPPPASIGTPAELDSKALFERWARRRGLNLRPRTPLEYEEPETQGLWECWQAARLA